MRKLLILAGMLATTGLAYAAPAHPQQTCAQATQTVARSGAAVIYSAPEVYDRFVSNASFCAPGQTVEPAWISTGDQRACPVGYRCIERQRTVGVGR